MSQPLSNVFPDFAEFKRLARRGNVIPVATAVVADLVSPVAAYLKLANPARETAHPYSFLLESVEGGERVARYTYFGADPFQTVACRGREITVTRDGRRMAESGNVFDYLRETGSRYCTAEPAGMPPFSAGAVGYVAYEAVRQLEHLPPRVEPDVELDDAFFMYYRHLVAFDHVAHRMLIISNVFTELGAGTLEGKYRAAVRELERMRRTLESQHVPLPSRPGRSRRAPLPVTSSLTRRRYEQIVRSAHEYILAGDIFQVVLSLRLAAPLRVPAFEVYRALRVVNPSPYLYFLRLGPLTVIGSSPEMLVKVSGRALEYRPIAGTRPRGRNEDEDLALERELLADEKERAEHLMLVDLGRNDLGRVAETGSVRPRELMFVERYSHVMHLVSRLEATLHSDCDSYAALAACFPAGTLSGAPKIRAMEIIDELEPTRRGLYGGAVLYADFSGNLNACIAIRTIVARDRMAYVQAGAGIVADSVPAREYEESLNKARALLKAIEIAEGR
ncbi:MAG TPA: anthranilate synthase component I [Terriglobia bacterium]|nr:anthranilate synthase component I [Terriglobia bacterium]